MAKPNKIQGLQNLMFAVKKSNPKGLLFLYDKYLLGNPNTDLYPEITFISAFQQYGKPFADDYAKVILNPAKVKYAWGDGDIGMDDLNTLSETLQDVGTWCTGVGTVADAAITTDKEKADAAAKLEEKAAEEKKVEDKSKTYLYTAIGVIGFLLLVVIVLKFKK
ncbi:MAG: hypothetical protein WC389_12385 [Lutibacter sp.]|jgi:hypothetical protein